MRGRYLKGAELLILACAVRGYSWEKRKPLFAHERPWVVFDGNGIQVGTANNKTGCKRVVLADFVEWLEELVKGI